MRVDMIQMKLIISSIVALSSLFLGTSLFADTDVEKFITVDSTKSAKINIYVHESKRDDFKEKPVLLVHGFNSSGIVWRNEKKDYVDELIYNGYDVIVVDMRGNSVDTDGDNIVDGPVVGDSWGYGVRELGDDVGTALQHGIGYLNDSLPGRNYTKADVITHSTGALAVTAYSRSQGLINYRNNIGTIIELAPPNNGSTNRVANIKNTAQVIPSVFTQSITAYEYCLELLSSKVWIPGGRMESETLRKELMPESLFLKSIEGLGPDERIKTFIAIGDEDWVVGDWSPVIEDRDDIGYEYFIGLDHFNFCNSGLVMKALLDKLEKGEESSFFGRYKPYKDKNILAFLLGPGTGIDHPDDTYDVVTFAKKIDISPRKLFDLYLRIAGRKGKVNLLKYWKAISIFEEAQEQIDQGASEEEAIFKWQDVLAEQNKILQDSFATAQEEYLQCPDIAILANGYYIDLARLIIEKLEEPVRIIDHTFSPSIVDEQKVLAIPTGGLSGISGSSIFRKKLSEYVENGGTLICFSQQYGHDFEALPTGELKGYGWQEDALCYAKAAYIEDFHQILSHQIGLYPDVKIDGYFTEYPEGAKILLRRTKNLMPAILMYNYGKGMVITAALYSGWGYTNGQTNKSEIDLVRGIVRWSKNSRELPEYKIGEEFEQAIECPEGFDRIKMILRSPDGDTLEENIAGEAQYSPGIVLKKAGIYRVDYMLYDSGDNIIQPQTEGFYFCFSQPPEGSVVDSDFVFDITSDNENYITGHEAVFTFNIRNNTDQDETIRCKGEMRLHEIEFTETIEAPAKKLTSFDKKIAVTKTERIMAKFYSSENSYLGRAERGINIFQPITEASIKTDKMQYTPGENVLIESAVLSNSEAAIDLFIILNIIDSDNREVYYNTKSVRLNEGEKDIRDHEFEIPDDAPRDMYSIKLNVFSNDRLVGQSNVNIDVPWPLIFEKNGGGDTFFKLLTIEMAELVYSPGEPVLAKVIIDNKGANIDEAMLDIRVLPTVETGDLWGIIRDDEGEPVRGALINSVCTNEDGKYRLEKIKRGNVVLNIRAPGFDSVTKNVEILPGENELDFTLTPAKYGDLYGTIENAVGAEVVLEPVSAAGSDACARNAVVITDNSFEFRHLPVGTYSLKIQPGGVTETIEINESDNNIVLDSLEQYSSSESTVNGQAEESFFIETEPNDYFDTANEVTSGNIVSGSIYDYGDEDFFKFQVDTALILDIFLTGVPDGLSPYIIIHDSSGNWRGTEGALSGEGIEYSLEIVNPGEYFIHLKDRYNSFSSEEEYALEVNLISGSDEYEPNHDFATATEIDIKQELICTMFPNADEDFFVFDIDEKGILFIKMPEVPDGLRPSIKIYDSVTSNVISQKGGASGENIELETEIGESGRYFLMVKDWYSSFSSLEIYSFKSFFINTLDEYEPNNTREEAVLVNFCQSYFATIAVKNDSDFYRLSIPDKGLVTVYLYDVPANIRPYIKLYKETRVSWIDSTAGSGGEDIEMQFETDEPSNYFIQVQDRYSSESSHLRYRLMVLYVPDDEYPLKDPALFRQEIELEDIKNKMEIELEIPGIDEIGKYYLVAGLSASDPKKNAQSTETFYVGDPDALLGEEPLPDIGVSYIDEVGLLFNAGEKANFRFEAVNNGNKGGACSIDFRFKDLFSDTLSEFIEPGVAKELGFEFTLPIDLEEGQYQAEYVFEGERHVIDFKINGLKVEVEAEFENNIFKIVVHNRGSAENVELFAEARCSGFEERKEFVLVDSAELAFSIPDVSGEDKIYYGMYFKSGKSVYLDSFLLNREDGEKEKPSITIIKAGCDKGRYENGETILLDWKIDSPEDVFARLVAELIWPDSNSEDVIDEDIELEKGLNTFSAEISPELEVSGMYQIVYKFYQDEEMAAQAALFLDVGNEIKVTVHLGANEYFEDEDIALTVGIFTSAPVSGELRVLLDNEIVETRGVSVDGYEKFDFDIECKSLGKHKIYALLFYDEKKKDSDKASFSVLARPKPNHSPVLFTIGKKEIIAGEPLEFFVEAQDIDGDALVYSCEGSPDGAIFEAEARRFFWRPRYDQVGHYFVTFSVSDGEDWTSEKVKITVIKAVSLPPEARPLAEPISGMAPLEVSFSDDSIDKDGRIVKYEWDFDGKGVYDFSSLESGNTFFVYTGKGDFSVSLRMTDDEGQTDTHEVVIKVNENPDAPMVLLGAEPSVGAVPGKVYFQGSVFSLADICRYEWDFDGDGVYDTCSVDSSEVVNTYSVPGAYDAELRVTSSNGLSGAAVVRVEISDTLVLDAELMISDESGDVPIEVDFDALVDAKNAIQKYQWDFEGDGIFDFTSRDSAICSNTYYKPGVYAATLKVTDEKNVSCRRVKEIRFGVPESHETDGGKIKVAPRKGKAPFEVKFSFETSCVIGEARYSWDFDNDGACDLVTDLAEAEFTYHDSGVYLVRLHVMRDKDVIGTYQETIYVFNGKSKNNDIMYPAGSDVDKTKNVSKDKADKIGLSDGTYLDLPAGILENDDVVDIKKLAEENVHNKIISEQENLASAGEYREYKFRNHNQDFIEEMVISIPYQDADEDGFVDERNIDELTLAMYWLDEDVQEWQRLSGSLVFPTENLVTARTNHFSLFGIAGTETQDEDPAEDSGGSDGGGGGGGVSCFIATAVFDTPLAQEVKILCEVRDKYLLQSEAGREFVRLYYKFSPPIAEFIKNRPLLKALVRYFLKSLVKHWVDA